MNSKSFLLLLLALSGCFLYMYQPLGRFLPSLFDISMVILAACLIAYIAYSQKSPLKGYWIRPSILFLIGYLAVNLQYIADFRLGLKTTDSRMILHEDVLNHCLLLGVIGLIAFVSGYISKPIKIQNVSLSPMPKQTSEFRIVFLSVLNVLVFVAFLLTIDFVSFVTGADYGNSDRVNSQFEGLLYVTNALIVCSVCMKSSENITFGKYIRSFPTSSLIVIALYMIMRLMSGDRGPFIYTALLLFFGYAYCTRKKIKFTHVLVYVFSGMLLMSLVGIARSLEINRTFGERIGEAFDIFTTSGRFGDKGDRSIFPYTEEMGFSFVVNQTDVYAVEEKGEPLNYGTY